MGFYKPSHSSEDTLNTRKPKLPLLTNPNPNPNPNPYLNGLYKRRGDSLLKLIHRSIQVENFDNL